MSVLKVSNHLCVEKKSMFLSCKLQSSIFINRNWKQLKQKGKIFVRKEKKNHSNVNGASQGQYDNYYTNIIVFSLLCIHTSFNSYNGYDPNFFF